MIATANDGIERDRWGRPKIYPKPGRGKTHADVIASKHRTHQPKGYRRTTTFISILEDRYALEQWAQRMAIAGTVRSEDLTARALAADPTEDRDALNAIAREALDGMRTKLKADMGSYLHACTEHLDRGGSRSDLLPPAEWASLASTDRQAYDLRDDDYPLADRDADLDAYDDVKRRYGLRFATIETMRVFDPWEVAGTPDRTGTGTDERFGNKWLVLDLKTGGDLDYDNTKRTHAMQLAMYAHSTAYTAAEGRHDDVPPVNRDRGVIIHLPARTGQAVLHFADLKRGWAGCVAAQRVWEWRKERDMLTKVDEWQPANHLQKLALNPSFAEAAAAAGSKDELRELWARAYKSGPGVLNDGFKAAVKKRLAELEAVA
ncbi:exonuclease [Mycobacterium phage DS6A]|uniref:PD-(D/E)XK endonuclease-like domain-containing protein n=1 Tax=Mycobacterium phage DS6A TaxID=45764 RepID=G8I4H9_9CAUD|nr:exonuclease [Mycobacterium phage DS6A]AER47623.1 hypothetical protein DS6A_69 [Mycobacterium phage DS6A]